MGRARSAVVDEAEPLAFRVLEVERRASVALDDALMRDAAGPMAGMNIPGMPKLF